ncbi:hypothetical protein AB1K70_26690 [Bremerella sp. JC770]|uniref:hypothetical protein n=1 Tax=Bremerella sp. JC770 TaxID=3232137 RepID=UPI0034593C96
MILRRVVIRAGAIRGDVRQAAAALAVSRTIPADAITADLVAVDLFLEQTTQLQPPAVKVLESTSAADPKAAAGLAPGAIDLQATTAAGQLQAWRAIPADPLEGNLEITAGGLVPTTGIQQSSIELQAFHLVTDATAGRLIDLVAVELQAGQLVGQVTGSRTIPADAIAADLVAASEILVPAATWQAVAVEVLESTSATDPTAAADLAPGAIELQATPAAGQLQAWRTIPADPLEGNLEITAGGMVPTTRIQQSSIELQAFQKSRQATAGGSVDQAAVELPSGLVGGLVSGSRAIPAGLIGSDLVAASEILVPAATWQAFAAEVILGPKSVDPTAAAVLAPGAIELQAGHLVDLASGGIELQAFGFELHTGTGNSTRETEVLLQFFGFDLVAMPGQAEGDASGTIAAASLHAAADLVAGQLQAWQTIAADPLEGNLEITAGGLVPSVSLLTDPVELQAFHLVTDTTAGGSIDLVALELASIDLAGQVSGSRTIPAEAIAAEVGAIAWRGFGPVLIAPPELVYTLPSAWPYYCLADNRLAFDLDDQRLAFDLVDNRLGYDLGPGWYQFDLRDNLLIYRLEE